MENDREIHPHTLIGQTVTVHYEPYGSYQLLVQEVGEYNGHPFLVGVVTEGVERAYLLGATSTRDIQGQRREVYGLRDEEVKRREFRRIAM